MFGKKNEKQQKINELQKRFEEIKNKSLDPNLSNEDFEELQIELKKINEEIDSLM